MSASSKKKLRKEQNAAQLTEKQRRQESEAKKVKAYTITFVAVILVVVLTMVGTLSVRAVNQSGVFEKNTVAATIGDHKLNSVTMGYYYGDAISSAYSSWYNQYGSYVSAYAQLMGLDLSKSLNKQVYDKETGMTWAGFFVSNAMTNAKSDYALYDKAVSDGFKMTEDTKKQLDTTISNLSIYAAYYGYKNANKYLQATYGYGSDVDSYRQYLEVTALANDYYTAHNDSLTYDDDALRAHEKDRYNEYSSYNGAYYYMSYTAFLEGGTKDDKGNTTYTDEERDAAREKVKQVAESLTSATTVEEFDKLITKLEINKDKKDVSSTKYEDRLYSTLTNADIQEWFADKDRKEGDSTVIANTSTSKDEDGKETTTVNGYYVVFFESRNDNTRLIGNVRHILVAFEGGTKDKDGNVTYSEKEKLAAKEAAEKLMAKWKEGEATEDSFIAMVTKENTDDTASIETGGLYENITPDSTYVPEFEAWAIDPERKAGDVGVIATDYGYHFMYYVGDGGTYRDFLITNDLRSADMEKWYNDIVDNAKLVEGKTNRLQLDKIIASAY